MGWLSKMFKGSRCRHGAYAVESHPSGCSWESRSETEDRSPSIAFYHKGKISTDEQPHFEDDEQVATNFQESLYVDPLLGPVPQSENGTSLGNEYEYRHIDENLYQPITLPYSTSSRICAGCNIEIGHERLLSCIGAVWHPECFRCQGCSQPISDNEFSTSRGYPYHKACYEVSYYPKCDICTNFIPTNAAGLVEYRAQPFWSQNYCPSHEHDGTPQCCSCEQMESWDAKFAVLDDGRKLCSKCLDSAIMDTDECQPLFLDIQEFFEGLNMKIKQQVPLLLVDKQALVKALDGEKHGHHHMPETRGLCLLEEQSVTPILRPPRLGFGIRVPRMRKKPCKLVRRCEVTAILILYGLPRLLTGLILAHEMMHAWLRLNSYGTLRQDVEEGICQVLASMWLKSQILSTSSSDSTTTSLSSGSPFEKKLGAFLNHQMATDTSAVYGNGYRDANQAVLKFGLRKTLHHMKETGNFPS